MADDNGAGVSALQHLENLSQCPKLLRGKVVLGLIVLIDTARKAHTDTRGIVALYMGADIVKMTAELQRAIAANNGMVADTLPAVCLVPVVDIGRTDIHVRRGCRAMDNDMVSAVAPGH